jgi:hypothetical protein
MHPNKKTAGVTDGPFVEIDALAGARTFEFVSPYRPREIASAVPRYANPSRSAVLLECLMIGAAEKYWSAWLDFYRRFATQTALAQYSAEARARVR